MRSCAHGAGACAGRPGLDGRRFAVRALELGGRARRSRCRPVWTPPGCHWRSSSCRRRARRASARRRRVVRAAWLGFTGRAGLAPRCSTSRSRAARSSTAPGDAGSRTDVGIKRRQASPPSATSPRAGRAASSRVGARSDPRLHRHALALRLAAVGQPPSRVEDPPGRDHRGRRQLRLFAGARVDRVPGRSASASRSTSRRAWISRWRSVGEYLRAFDAGRHRAQRRPAGRPRHPAHRRHGLRAASADRAPS